MSDEIIFTIHDLYKTLKKCDKEILKHFNDDDLSDNNYLFYAINSDIVTNTISVVMNVLIENEYSVGVDNNVRSIIEGFVLLNMLGSGKISSEQQKIFRSHFAIVDYENFKKGFNKQKDHPLVDKIKQRYDEAVNILCGHYGCSRKNLKKTLTGYDDPLFYIKNQIDDDISFDYLINKYPIFGNQTLRMYEFFSIMVHPRYIDSNELEEAIHSTRKEYIDFVLDYVVRYLQASGLIIIDDEIPNFDDDFTNNPVLFNNVINIKQIDMMLEMLIEDLCFLNDGFDYFQYFSFALFCRLIKDMMLCESLGFHEQVISKYKSFIEFASIHAAINSAENQDEFKKLKKAFAISSKLQLEEYIKSINLGECCESNELNELFETYYKEKFNIPSLEDFEKGMRENSLYFLNPEESKSYNLNVKKAIGEIIRDEEIKSEMLEMYKLSKDMNHASGYNFNSNPGISEFHARRVMRSVFVWIINLIDNSTSVVEEMDHKTKFIKTIIEFLKAQVDFECVSMESIGKKYEEDYNKNGNQ